MLHRNYCMTTVCYHLHGYHLSSQRICQKNVTYHYMIITYRHIDIVYNHIDIVTFLKCVTHYSHFPK